MPKKMKKIKGWKDIPAFETEKEEQEFWSTHETSEEMLEQMSAGPLPPPRPRKQLLSIRMEGELLNRLKALAAVKGVGYQTLLRQFVADRVYEEEKREGILK